MRTILCGLSVLLAPAGWLGAGPRVDLEAAIERVSENFGMRVGVEYREPRVSVEFPSRARSGESAVAAIVRQAPGFSWRMERGVAQVFQPVVAKERRNWLNLPWSEDGSARPMTTNAVSTVLMQGVEEQVRGKDGGGRGGSFPGVPEEPRFRLSAGKAAVRERLNEVLRLGRARMWVVRFSAGPELSGGGFFETAGPLWRLTSMRAIRGPMVVKHPVVLRRVQPAYTDEARRLGLEGTVMLRIEAGTDGKPTDVRGIKFLGCGLDEQAIRAARQWRFRPVLDGGRPAPMTTTVGFAFALEHRDAP